MNSEEKIKRHEEMAPFGKVILTIEYDGANYFGWQRQEEERPTIQRSVENALFTLFAKKTDLVGAGRTDAGVHATNQVAHFRAPRDVKTYNFVHAFQALLPRDIVVKGARLTSAHFHAQNNALSKTYIYRIWNSPVPSALRSGKSLWIRQPLNLDRLNDGCRHLVGNHDFNTFRSEGSRVESTVRTVNSAKFSKVGDFIEFEINGTGFLKQMVRNIVGTLLQIELNGRAPESIPSLILSRNRQNAGPTVEPQGLYLERVYYAPELDNSAQPL